jgi:hypothetical protein
MRLACCAMLALAACYAPKLSAGAPCDLSDPASCPIGQTCEAAAAGARCSDGTTVTDAGATIDSAPGIDAPLGDAGNFCLGNQVLGSVCFLTAPKDPRAFASSATINTDSMLAGNCTEIRAQPGGQPVCLVVGTTISIASGVTVRAIGPNPLVLVARQTITIDGQIDVATHVTDSTIGGKPVVGAGARSAIDCNELGVDGAASQNADNGGGGGAGGSFGGLGGAGGNGRQSTAKGGMAKAPPTSSLLVGGCPGGHGGDGAGAPPSGGGEGGGGGGAIYLLAGTSISVAGKINASGAGGGAGLDGFNSSGGAGGGGSGGLIGLEAPTLTVAGVLFANGGGGGGGGGNDFNKHGAQGSDPVAPLTAALAGKGGDGGGGDGGVGSTVTAIGAAGKTAANDSGNGIQGMAGGSGGGGGGVIKLFGTATTTGAMISPPPAT